MTPQQKKDLQKNKLKKSLKKITKNIKHDVVSMLHKYYRCPDRRSETTNNS